MGGLGTANMTAQDYTSPSSQGRYRKLFKVGRGGMGDVHLALSTGHGSFRKLVVLKCRRQSPDEENDRRGMFLEEGRLAALLNHPNIVQTYEVGELDGTDYIAMEFLEGQPVSQLSSQSGGLAPRLVAYIAEQVLRGLHYAQELRDLDGSPLNIIHRDLSPENIFVTYDGAVKVLDFGIAKSDARSREVTEAGVLKGKLSYMAPEQVETFTADRRTDIFVLGMVMWELITGKRLNSHRSAVDQFRWLTEGKVPSLLNSDNVDPELDAIVQTACQRKPQSRYATAQEMRHALEGYLARNGGGGAAEHLSRVMLSHFGRVRDSMRLRVRQRIQELESEPEWTTVGESPEQSPDRPSVITYVVQNSDLFSGDDNYRNETTGRITAPRRSSWPRWVAAGGVAAACVAWFQYARTVGNESITFQMLPESDGKSIPAAGAAVERPATTELGDVVPANDRVVNVTPAAAVTTAVAVTSSVAVTAPAAMPSVVTTSTRVVEAAPRLESSVNPMPAMSAPSRELAVPVVVGSVPPRTASETTPSSSVGAGPLLQAPGRRLTEAAAASHRPSQEPRATDQRRFQTAEASRPIEDGRVDPVTPRVDGLQSTRVPRVN